MAQKENGFERFWRELKRRKVIHVITVYAAVAFVILQLVDMVAEPLRLPASTKALVIVLLCIGFIIAVFVSWIYDITPAGIRKTKPVGSLKHTDHTAHPESNRWKIATYSSAAIIIALIALNFFNKRGLNTDISRLDKSIAVLPFYNDSSSDSTTYFINGLMDEILNNLQKIGSFSRVPGRTSTEQYRGTSRPPIPKIARDLNVSFIVEGSGQKYGNSYKVIVQLLDGKRDRHLWGNSYKRVIESTKDIYETQSEIAQSIAKALRATITPEEKQLIEKTQTASLTALDFYNRGREELAKYQFSSGNTEVLTKAEVLYKRALEHDSTFALAYTGLAAVYWDKHYRKEYFSEHFMDSVLSLANVALSFNDKLDEAYTLKGSYYYEKGNPEQAIKEFDKAIKINPNSWGAYYGKVPLSSDIVTQLENLHKAASLNHGAELPDILRDMGEYYCDAGFIDKARHYILEALKLDGDSVNYLYYSGYFEDKMANYGKSVEFLERCYKLDSTNINTLWLLGQACMAADQIERSLKIFKEFEFTRKTLGTEYFSAGAIYHRIGYAYYKNGYKKEAEYYFNIQLEESNNTIKSERPWSREYYTYYDIAAIYAFRGQKEKAFENLRIFNQRKFEYLWMLSLIKNDPLFDNIRNEPEFQQILKDVENKYQAEHERVKKWLEEKGML